jgi:diacylglycerol kinase (ATP)
MLDGVRSAAIIYNPLAGRRRDIRTDLLKKAQKVLADAGISAELVPTEAAGQAGALAVRAAASGADLIVACGGDGTLNEIVNGMTLDARARRTPLAVLPAGTANVLAKELGIPWDLPRAAGLVRKGVPVRISLGKMTTAEEGGVGERYFLSLAGAGPDGALVHSLDVSLKLKAGVLAYWLEGAKQLFKYNFPKFRMKTETGEYDATLAVIGRTKHYGGPFRITTGADLFGDEFEVVLFMSSSALRYLSYLPATWFGRLPKLPDVRIVKTRRMSCTSLQNENVYTQVDGEPVGKLPATFEIVQDALTLVVPEVVARELAGRRENAIVQAARA